MSEESKKTSTGLQENIESLLCYLGMWVTGIVFAIIEKENKTVLFHAWQSIFTFGILHIASIVLSFVFSFFIPHISSIIGYLIGILMLVLWIILMLKSYQGQMYKVPVFGELAEKQVGK
jgi:uncharacterized membrane protein